MSADEKLLIRQSEAKPLWNDFIDWALQTQIQGVRHAGTSDALAYLLKHAEQLQTYCNGGRVFSLIETARANGHNPQQYLSVLLTELPAIDNFEDIDTLLPWAITPDEIATRYKSYPTP